MNLISSIAQEYSHQTEQELQKVLGKPLFNKLKQEDVLGFDTQ